MTTNDNTEHEEVTRRNFLYVATGAVAAVGGASTVWPLIHQMNPSADVLALSSIEVDLSSIALGQTIKVLFRGKPIFIRHRTDEEIAKAKSDDTADLPDPAADSSRVLNPEWLVMIGTCTHLGCVPLDQRGDFGGWFCPCHGSHYDISGRIRKGPAPRNLDVPTYAFINDNTIKIG